ncbi:O-antigen polymerase [Leptospira interrogans serovar Canicola]|nr:O-antigen polymerase [Leptospira interrogans serovar Canicola]
MLIIGTRLKKIFLYTLKLQLDLNILFGIIIFFLISHKTSGPITALILYIYSVFIFLIVIKKNL